MSARLAELVDALSARELEAVEDLDGIKILGEDTHLCFGDDIEAAEFFVEALERLRAELDRGSWPGPEHLPVRAATPEQYAYVLESGSSDLYELRIEGARDADRSITLAVDPHVSEPFIVIRADDLSGGPWSEFIVVTPTLELDPYSDARHVVMDACRARGLLPSVNALVVKDGEVVRTIGRPARAEA